MSMTATDVSDGDVLVTQAPTGGTVLGNGGQHLRREQNKVQCALIRRVVVFPENTGSNE